MSKTICAKWYDISIEIPDSDSKFAIDFECYYDNEVSVKKMPIHKYINHKLAEPYLVSIAGDNYQYVGPPEKCPWAMFNGAVLYSHNVKFDYLVWNRLQKSGIIPVDVNPVGWRDTADMAAYFKYPRNLKGACEEALGIKLDKQVLKSVKGMNRRELENNLELYSEITRYSLLDADACYKLAKKLEPNWPAHEMLISQLSRETSIKGIRVDLDLLDYYTNELNRIIWLIERRIPWQWDTDTPLQRVKIIEECRKCGIEVPASFSHTSDDCRVWENKYADKYDWVKAIRACRLAYFYKAKLDTLRNALDGDTFLYDLKYCGAAVTGRYSAGFEDKDSSDSSGTFSVHGLPKEPARFDSVTGDALRKNEQTNNPVIEFDLRKLLIARNDKTFIIWDFAQIEPRLIHWFCGNMSLLNKIREKNISVYQAEAEQTYKWNGKSLKEEDPDLYMFIKTSYLGAQYQCSGISLFKIARKYEIDISIEKANEVVETFRRTNPAIPALWKNLQQAIFLSFQKGEDLKLVLPSGRVLTYWNLRLERDIKDVANYDGNFAGTQIVADVIKGQKIKKIYGGALTNNLVQGTGRDLLVYKGLLLHQAGIGWPLWTVHDEGINEVDINNVENIKKEVYDIISKEVEWLKGLPISCELTVSNHYKK